MIYYSLIQVCQDLVRAYVVLCTWLSILYLLTPTSYLLLNKTGIMCRRQVHWIDWFSWNWFSFSLKFVIWFPFLFWNFFNFNSIEIKMDIEHLKHSNFLIAVLLFIIFFIKIVEYLNEKIFRKKFKIIYHLPQLWSN